MNIASQHFAGWWLCCPSLVSHTASQTVKDDVKTLPSQQKENVHPLRHWQRQVTKCWSDNTVWPSAFNTKDGSHRWIYICWESIVSLCTIMYRWYPSVWIDHCPCNDKQRQVQSVKESSNDPFREVMKALFHINTPVKGLCTPGCSPEITH